MHLSELSMPFFTDIKLGLRFACIMPRALVPCHPSMRRTRDVIFFIDYSSFLCALRRDIFNHLREYSKPPNLLSKYTPINNRLLQPFDDLLVFASETCVPYASLMPRNILTLTYEIKHNFSNCSCIAEKFCISNAYWVIRVLTSIIVYRIILNRKLYYSPLTKTPKLLLVKVTIDFMYCLNVEFSQLHTYYSVFIWMITIF